jgi:hypothetical protein
MGMGLTTANALAEYLPTPSACPLVAHQDLSEQDFEALLAVEHEVVDTPTPRPSPAAGGFFFSDYSDSPSSDDPDVSLDNSTTVGLDLSMVGASDLEMSVDPLDNPSNVETMCASDRGAIVSVDDFALLLSGSSSGSEPEESDAVLSPSAVDFPLLAASYASKDSDATRSCSAADFPLFAASSAARRVSTQDVSDETDDIDIPVLLSSSSSESDSDSESDWSSSPHSPRARNRTCADEVVTQQPSVTFPRWAASLAEKRASLPCSPIVLSPVTPAIRQPKFRVVGCAVVPATPSPRAPNEQKHSTTTSGPKECTPASTVDAKLESPATKHAGHQQPMELESFPTRDDDLRDWSTLPDLACPLCYFVGKEKIYSVPGLQKHLSNHVLHKTFIPAGYWKAQTKLRCCAVTECGAIYANVGQRTHLICPPCRKTSRIASEPAKIAAAPPMREIETNMGAAPPLSEFPSLDEIFAHPLCTETRIPIPIRRRWKKMWAKLASDATHFADLRHHLLLAMFSQAGLCVRPRAGRKNSPFSFYSKQLDAWENNPLGLWRKLKARQRPPSRKNNDSAAERGKRAVAAAEEKPHAQWRP